MNFNGNVVSPLHTNQVFDPNQFQALIKELSRRVWQLQKTLKFDALAGCGNSGLLVLGGLAARRKMPVWAVRKNADTDHDSRLANGFLLDGKVTRYLIVDDLISSGTTVNRIVKHISKVTQHATPDYRFVQMSEPVGVLTYCNAWMGEGALFQLEDGRRLPTFHIR